MSEIARFSVARPDADVAVAPTAQFEAFFEAEKDQLYRALCLVTRTWHEAEDDAGSPHPGARALGASRGGEGPTATCTGRR